MSAQDSLTSHNPLCSTDSLTSHNPECPTEILTSHNPLCSTDSLTSHNSPTDSLTSHNPLCSTDSLTSHNPQCPTEILTSHNPLCPTGSPPPVIPSVPQWVSPLEDDVGQQPHHHGGQDGAVDGDEVLVEAIGEHLGGAARGAVLRGGGAVGELGPGTFREGEGGGAESGRR